VEKNLSIVTASNAADFPDGSSVSLVVHEDIYNQTTNYSLLSEFQLRESGVKIGST
jgi:hypothetical protein